MALVLSRNDLESILTMRDNIRIVEQAFKEYMLGNVKMPLRPTISLEESHGLMAFMPAHIGGGMNALGIKVVSVFQDNVTKHNLPTILGTILLFDARTGALSAIMDGAFLTAMRTGAASGVATKYMAREDAKTVGMFGAGVQAETQLLAICEVRDITAVKVLDPNKPKANSFCEKMEKIVKAEVSVSDSAKEVVETSDIIVAATTSRQPLFKGEWLKPGCHINGIGSHHGPGSREVDGTTVKRSRVVADSREACLKEAGDLIDPISEGLITQDHIYAELGELVVGKKKGRLDKEEITFFKSVGLALEDMSTALMVLELAKKKGIGKTISL